MKSLVLLSILIAAVKAREVHYDQGQLIDNYAGQGGFLEDMIIVNEPFSENGCEKTMPYTTEQLTVTTTELWLNTVRLSSLVLGSTWYTVFVTTTEYMTTTDTSYESPLTFTALPKIDSIWKTVTETKTEVVDETFVNMVHVTKTSTISAEAIEASVECNTHLVDGDTNYFTRTTFWTHTQTMHDKVMVETEVEVTVTSTRLISNIDAERYTKYVTRTETAIQTKFETFVHTTASTLWVTHAVKTDCP